MELNYLKERFNEYNTKGYYYDTSTASPQLTTDNINEFLKEAQEGMNLEDVNTLFYASAVIEAREFVHDNLNSFKDCSRESLVELWYILCDIFTNPLYQKRLSYNRVDLTTWDSILTISNYIFPIIQKDFDELVSIIMSDKSYCKSLVVNNLVMERVPQQVKEDILCKTVKDYKLKFPPVTDVRAKSLTSLGNVKYIVNNYDEIIKINPWICISTGLNGLNSPYKDEITESNMSNLECLWNKILATFSEREVLDKFFKYNNQDVIHKVVMNLVNMIFS